MLIETIKHKEKTSEDDRLWISKNIIKERALSTKA